MLRHRLWNPQFSSVLSLSWVRLFVTPWTAAQQASLSITNSWSLFRLVSIESVMSSNHLIFCRPLLRVRWPKYWSFSFSISLSKEYSGLISFRTDWFDLLEFQGTLKSLLQHHSSKASILQLMNRQTYHQILSASFTVHATLSNYSSL